MAWRVHAISRRSRERSPACGLGQREIDHRGSPQLAVGSQQLEPKTTPNFGGVSLVGLPHIQGEASNYRHTPWFEHGGDGEADAIQRRRSRHDSLSDLATAAPARLAFPSFTEKNATSRLQQKLARLGAPCRFVPSNPIFVWRPALWGADSTLAAGRLCR